MMQALRVTAYLATPIVAFDEWTPSLENILIWQVLDRAGCSVAAPTPATATANQLVIDRSLPIAKGTLGDDWYYQVSAPHYLWEWNSDVITHKRWDRQEDHLDWQGRRKTWNSQGFYTKSKVNRVPIRFTPMVDWFCVGDREALLPLLTRTTHLGMQRRGQVLRWQVQPWDDWHLWGGDGQLMKPIPIAHLPTQRSVHYRQLQWGWRSPVTLASNITACAMPIRNTKPIDRAA